MFFYKKLTIYKKNLIKTLKFTVNQVQFFYFLQDL